MGRSAKIQIDARKNPKQSRSGVLVSAILEAAVRVLRAEGAARFTTARVAERAGISVGSLYQYFPNKAAILFRLQSDEWKQTAAEAHLILADADTPPIERMRVLVHRFVQSECDEAAIRMALQAAVPGIRDEPDPEDTGGQGMLEILVHQVLAHRPEAARQVAAELVDTTLGEVARRFSERPRTLDEIERHAEAMADMFESYLRHAAAN
ncbi:TetR family transcriptional regulator [Rhizosaccharibacter radicis]|uniref:TetR family transcriptional regulator n=1 Tax=Rhizosaccharibacter radicis TaxID=2782605 RepID=A0ABT1VWN3_9PROT|nr:TetR family transcriptional regulator [Acetobacteraceae bacterium KSS12]